MHCPDQKKFFQMHDLYDLFKLPPPPTKQHSTQDLILPQKRSRENRILETLLDPEGVKRHDDIDISASLDVSRLREIDRLREHAKE